jgi:hypothetical protein
MAEECYKNQQFLLQVNVIKKISICDWLDYEIIEDLLEAPETNETHEVRADDFVLV